MDPDPILDAFARAFPVVLLALLGLLSIYSVVGVPIGLLLLGTALGMAILRFREVH